MRFVKTSPTTTERSHHFDVPWMLVLLGLALSIVVAGIAYLHHRQEQVRQAAHGQLEIIAELKAQQLADWLQERRTDADWIAATPYAARRALDALAQPDSATTRNMFTAWLKPLRSHRFYERFILLDENLNIALEYPPSRSTNRTVLAEAALQAARKAAQTRLPCMTDLHGADHVSPAHLDFAVPLSVAPRLPRDAASTHASPGSPPPHSAVLVMQVNASAFLDPLLQTWPTPFQTAETILIRLEGEEVMYLSDLRHRSNTTPPLRLPLSQHELPAAMALRGERVHEGLDYHGVPVIAATRTVPGTSWLMETKVDKSEAYQSLQRETLEVTAVGAAVLLAAVMGVWMFWRHRQQIIMANQLQAERRQRVLAERFEHLMRSAADAILLADERENILEANERAQTMYGYTLSELQALTLSSLGAPDQGEAPPSPPEPWGATASSSEGITQEARHRRADGTVFPVEVSSRDLRMGEARCRLAIIRDISKRKEAEEELSQRNDELTRFNQASVGRELRMVELKQEINELCRQIGLERRYALSFLSAADPPATTTPDSPGPRSPAP